MISHDHDAEPGRPLNQQLDDAHRAAASLPPNDRLRLIVRLWASLPPEHWAAPTPAELDKIARKLAGAAACRRDDEPWEIVRDVLDLSARDEGQAAEKLYSAPRRFDLATIFVVTAAYSLLLGLMRSSGVPPLAVALVAMFITVVGAAQALFDGRASPRTISVIAGNAAWALGCMILVATVPRFELNLFAGVLSMISFGSPLGYMAGVLVGGVFLVADIVRQKYVGREESDSEDLGMLVDDVPNAGPREVLP